MPIRATIIIAGLCALAAHAWAQAPAPATAGKPSTAAAAAAPEPATPSRTAEGSADPRRCLEYSTNLEIHLCAEKYRPRKRNA